MNRNTPQPVNDTSEAHRHRMETTMPSFTPRQFAAGLGVLLALAGAIVLFLMPVSVTYDSGLLGATSIDCGTALVTNTVYGNTPILACSDALASRRAMGWPLAISGVIVVVAALFVQSPSSRRVDEHPATDPE